MIGEDEFTKCLEKMILQKRLEKLILLNDGKADFTKCLEKLYLQNAWKS